MLNPKEMREVIRQGGSVAYGGRIIKSLSDIPSDTDFALATSQNLEGVLSNLKLQKLEIEKEIALVEAALAENKTVKEPVKASKESNKEAKA